MNVLDLTLLIKDKQQRKNIKNLMAVKLIGAIMFYVLVLMFLIFAVAFEDAMAVLALVLVLYSFLFAAFLVYAHIKLNRVRKSQSLDDSKYDDAIKTLNSRYDTISRLRKKVLIAEIAAVFVLITVSVVIGLLNTDFMFEIVLPVSVLSALLFFVAEAYLVLKQTKIIQNSLKEIDAIKEVQHEEDGVPLNKRNRKNIFVVADGQKMMSYLYPDQAIRDKVQKSAMFSLIPAFIAGLAGGIAAVVIGQSQHNTGIIMPILFVILMAMIIVSSVISVKSQSKHLKMQLDLMQQNPEKYVHHIQLNKIHTEFQKKTNNLSFIIIGVGTVIATVLSFVFLAQSYIIVVLAFVLINAAVITYSVIASKDYRKQAKVIENQIDQAEKQQVSVDEVFEQEQQS